MQFYRATQGSYPSPLPKVGTIPGSITHPQCPGKGLPGRQCTLWPLCLAQCLCHHRLSHLLSSCHTSCPESHWLAHFRALWCAHVSLTSSPPSQQPCLPLSLRDNVGYGEHTARQGLLGTPPSPFLIRGAAMSHLWASRRDSQA